MPDNIQAPGTQTPITGPVFATDLNTTESAHWPISKVGFGTRDSQYNIVDSTHPLPTAEANTNEALSIAANSLTALGVLLSVDTLGYNSIACQIIAAGTTCTITYECSLDNTTWYLQQGYSSAFSGQTLDVPTSTAAAILFFPCVARYWRARISTYTSGTVTAQALLRRAILPKGAIFATGNVALIKSTNPVNAVTPSRIQSLATTNATLLKATGAVVSAITVQNNGAALAYFKLYNKASAPTVGTDAPLMTIMIPISGSVVIEPAAGLAFGTGLGYAITALSTDADTTAVAANQVTGYIAWA
jgi:hypothetical protein